MSASMSRPLLTLLAVAAGASVANVYYAQPLLDRLGQVAANLIGNALTHGSEARVEVDGREVIQLHLGGGTPNFLEAEAMTTLVEGLRRRFDFSDSPQRDRQRQDRRRLRGRFRVAAADPGRVQGERADRTRQHRPPVQHERR
ncbi:hypothetical protein ABGA94_17085, partial [Stenotrophomonas sp. 3diitr2024]